MGWAAVPCWGLAGCTDGSQLPYPSLMELLSPVTPLIPALVEPRFVDIDRVGFLRMSLTPTVTGLWSWGEKQTVAEGQD